MSKNNCELIKDLLPLYADEVCSEESRKAVAEHISQCDNCRKELEKMGQNLAIGADKDIKIIKRIKRRVWIERAVIAGIVVLTAFTGLFAFKMAVLDSISPMDYEEHNLAENIWVEVDENGDLWLHKKGIASQSANIFPTLRDANGNYMGYDNPEFDRDAVDGYGLTLDYRKVLDFSDIEIATQEEKTKLFNINKKENINEVFYYDEEENKEYTLWERD
ncbi:MAG: zf-HC2 domain-containing protein [Ruminococcus sp.]|nr:zf-HC2 domain-containing protein [Ruminococcus sp.]